MAKDYNRTIVTLNPDVYDWETKTNSIIVRVDTSPNRNNSDWVSFGRQIEIKDEFGDIDVVWRHYCYPHKWQSEPQLENLNITVRREFSGKGSSVNCRWKMKLPVGFPMQIAVIDRDHIYVMQPN